MVEKLDHILMIGRKTTGKSTFVSKMSPEFLVMDFDRRWTDLDVGGYIYSGEVLDVVSQIKRDKQKLLNVGTIAVDSGTSVMDPLQAKGRLEVETGVRKNLNDIHRIKADTMRTLRGVMLPFQANTVWIFHMEDRGLSGQAKVRTTISKVEQEALMINLNMIVVMDIDSKTGKRFLTVQWNRFNEAANGKVIKDTHKWEGVPKMLHDFVREYDHDMGYNGNAYGPEWLLDFLRQKGKGFESVDEMKVKLGVKEWPKWWNRNAWGEFTK